MINLHDLEKISMDKINFYLLVITSMLCPGILFIYLFNANFFLSSNTIKLVLLSISITSPLIFLNSILFSVSGTEKILQKNNIPAADISSEEIRNSDYFVGVAVSIGSLLSNVVLYPTLIIGYIFNFGSKSSILLMIFTQVAIILFFIITNRVVNQESYAESTTSNQ